MSYSDDAVNAKLSALNETTESIVTTGQWVMFHRRHADRTMKIWADKVKDANPNKKLNLVYLINEVAQQCKLKKRDEFRASMETHVVHGMQWAYKGSTNDIKQKLKRVVDVWKDRDIFEHSIIDEVDRKLAEIDRQVGSVKRPLFGGPSSGIATPSAYIPDGLEDLVKITIRVEKANLAVKANKDATKDWEASMNAIDMKTANPVNAARINGIHERLLKAHAAAIESVVSREAMIAEMERLLTQQKSLVAEHQHLMEIWADKKEKTAEKKTAVENALLQRMHYEKSWDPIDPPAGAADNDDFEPPRPEMEALTPPPPLEEDDYEPPVAAEDGSGTPPAMFGFEEAEDDEDDTGAHLSKKRKLGNGYAAFEEDDVDDLIASEGRA